jgi:hypothetical protein
LGLKPRRAREALAGDCRASLGEFSVLPRRDDGYGEPCFSFRNQSIIVKTTLSLVGVTVACLMTASPSQVLVLTAV